VPSESPILDYCGREPRRDRGVRAVALAVLIQTAAVALLVLEIWFLYATSGWRSGAW
jgi:hypothetical protein